MKRQRVIESEHRAKALREMCRVCGIAGQYNVPVPQLLTRNDLISLQSRGLVREDFVASKFGNECFADHGAEVIRRHSRQTEPRACTLRAFQDKGAELGRIFVSPTQ